MKAQIKIILDLKGPRFQNDTLFVNLLVLVYRQLTIRFVSETWP